MERRTVRGRAFFVLSAVVLVCVFAPRTSAAGGGGWETLRHDDGILVQRKEMPGSPFVAFRGEGDVNAPLLIVGSVLVDVSRSREWVDSVVESHLLRQVSDTEYVTYAHIGTPFPLTDREFVTDVVLSLDAASKTMTIRMHSVNDPAAPKTGFVRGDLVDGSWVLTSIADGKRTHVAAEIHANPKGSIPSWVVNMFQKNWGYNTLMSLRKQVAKPDTTAHPRLFAFLDQKGFFVQ